MKFNPTLAWRLATMAILVIVGTFIAYAPARSQGRPNVPCVPAEQGIGYLEKEHGEKIVFTGEIESQGIMIAFLISEKRTWSAVALTPDGQACLLQSGVNWQVMGPIPGGTKG